MVYKVDLTDEIEALRLEIGNSDNDNNQRNILKKFYEEAQKRAYDNAVEETTEKLKKDLQIRLSEFIRTWIKWFNILVFIILATIFLIGVCDVYSDTINIKGDILSSSVLISLIGATVAQTTAGFLVLNRWVFSDKKKGEPE